METISLIETDQIYNFTFFIQDSLETQIDFRKNFDGILGVSNQAKFISQDFGEPYTILFT